jgi:hypothetical protein
MTTLSLFHHLQEQVLISHNEKRWGRDEEIGGGRMFVQELRGKTVGVLGYGHVGHHLILYFVDLSETADRTGVRTSLGCLWSEDGRYVFSHSSAVPGLNMDPASRRDGTRHKSPKPSFPSQTLLSRYSFHLGDTTYRLQHHWPISPRTLSYLTLVTAAHSTRTLCLSPWTLASLVALRSTWLILSLFPLDIRYLDGRTL